MKGGKRPLGYTIIEVMIVLAISGVMFLLAAQFVSGKQQQTAFTQGTNEFTSQLQTIIAQVTNGQYSDIAFGCTASPGAKPTISATAGGGSQGKNSSCVFIAKMIHFNHGGDKSKYAVIPMAGSLSTAGQADTTLANTTPVISSDPDDNIDLTLINGIPQSLEVEGMQIDATGAGYVATALDRSVGFAQSTPTSDDTGRAYVTANQDITLVYTTNAIVAAGKVSLTPIKAVKVCITDGPRHAAITLGTAGGSNKLSAELLVTTGNTCV